VTSAGDRGSAERSIQRRGDSLRVRVYMGRDSATGRPRWATETVRGTGAESLRQAMRARRRLEREAELTKEVGVASAETVGALLDRWVRDTAPDKSPSTVDADLICVEHYLRPLRTVKLVDLKVERINDLYTELRTVGATAGKRAPRPLAPVTIRRVHQTLHASLSYGVDLGWLALNPAGRARRPKVVRKQRDVPSDAVLAALLADLEGTDPEFMLWLRIDAVSGARRGEVIGLRWSQVDFDAHELVISHDVVKGRRTSGETVETYLRTTTKTETPRRIAMDARTMAMLQGHRQTCQTNAAIFGVPFDGGGFVFAQEPDGCDPWRPDRVTQRFIRVRKRLTDEGVDLAVVRLGDLRHAAATKMIRAGDDITKVAARLGNSPRTIHANYLHEFKSHDRDSADRLAAGLDR